MIDPSEHLRQPSIATYEIAVADGSVEQVALLGLARALNLQVNQVEPGDNVTRPLETDEEITAARLSGISVRLFDDPMYGNTAGSILARVSDDYDRLAIIYDQRNRKFSLTDSRFFTRNTGSLGTERNAAVEAAYAVIKDSAPPFDFEIVLNDTRGSEFEYHQPFRVESGRMTSTRLAGHLATRGLNRHELSGSLGKALDVLNDAAGTSDPRSREVADDEPFVSLRAVSILAAQANLSDSVISMIKHKLTLGVRRQIETGRQDPALDGEIVIDGPFDANAYRMFSPYVLIAVRSLVGLTKDYPYNTAGAKFLKRLPELLQAAE
jgi:hypothetical protein